MKRLSSRTACPSSRTACLAFACLPAFLASAAWAAPVVPAAGTPGISQAKLRAFPQASTPGELPAAAQRSSAEALAANIPAYGSTDSSPAAHPEEYKRFTTQLDQIQKANSYQFFPAIIIILNTTGDELAVDDWMQKAADEGHLAALSFLANQRLSFVPLGAEMSDDVKAAYAAVRKAADAGFAPAVIPVVRCLRSGIGVAKDPEAGTAYLAKACTAGDFRLRYLWLTLTDRLRTMADKDRPEIKSELQRGNHYVAYELSKLSSQPAEKLDWLRKAADLGNDIAILELSNLLAPKDPKSSLTLLNEAVRRQNSDALFALGTMLIQDDGSIALKEAGLRHDEKVGTYMIRLAAMHGHPKAAFVMGTLYQFGKYGLPRNEHHAYEIFSQGTNQGNIASAIMEAYCKLTGTGTAQNIPEGNKALDQLLQTGHPLAALIKAYTYYKGIGCEPNPDKVMEYCLLASGSNFPPAYVHMASILSRGMPGLAPDPSRAETYIRMAELSLGDAAHKLYDELMAQPEWNPVFL